MGEKTNQVVEKGATYVMHTYHRFPIALEKGEGMYVWDMEGKKYLDFVAGIAVNALGYADAGLAEVIYEQSKKMIHCSNLYYNIPQVELAELLTKYSDFDKVFFCNSGAESIEGALKLARKYAEKTGKQGRNIICMEQSFHGRTYGAVTATGQTKYQKGLAPLLPGISHVPYNDFSALENEVDANTCGILMEVIQGEGGIIPAEKEYLQKVRALCDEKDIVLMFDEIQTGVGRTGTLFAHQGYGVTPHVATLAKGLAGGVPIGALLAVDKVAEAFSAGDHATTFGGNSLATAAGVYVLTQLMEKGILENVKQTGDYLQKELLGLQKKYDCIKDVRGMGLMQGIALSVPVGEVVAKAMDKGLLLVGAGSDVVRFVPALVAKENHVAECMKILDEVLATF